MNPLANENKLPAQQVSVPEDTEIPARPHGLRKLLPILLLLLAGFMIGVVAWRHLVNP